MASIRELNGKLFFDFRFKGQRCREYTAVLDNKSNRIKMEKVLAKIEEDIDAGRFEYRRYFPNSKNAQKFDSQQVTLSKVAIETQKVYARNGNVGITPLFSEFVELVITRSARRLVTS